MKKMLKFVLKLQFLGFLLTSCGVSTDSNVDNVSKSEEATYVISFESNGGSSVDSIAVKRGETVEEPSDPAKDGFDFGGWYKNSGLTNKYDFSTPVYSSFILYAKWQASVPDTWTVNFISEGTIISSQEVADGGFAVKPADPIIEGYIGYYQFGGWFKSDADVQYDFGTPVTSSFDLYAKWEEVLYSLSVLSEDASKGTVRIISGTGYCWESITVEATPAGNFAFEGWYDDGGIVSREATYTFDMPPHDYSLIARFWTKAEAEERVLRYAMEPILSEDGKTVKYGLYPQTHVNDPSLISSLDSMKHHEPNGWYLYEDDYYAKLVAEPYHDDYKFDDGTNIEDRATYWFRCEPIVWDVLSSSSSSGHYYVLSDRLLDANSYNGFFLERTIDGETIYPNNYKHSDIRAWLNGEFLDSAFALGDECIETTMVDNSASTTDRTSNVYACDNTKDKVFLPSYQDYSNPSYGFSADAARQCKTTDWARARLACYSTVSDYLYNGMYWTRSPGSDYSYKDEVWFVNCGGRLSADYFAGAINVCVRPAITITIA